MRFTRPKEKRVARLHDDCSILVANTPLPRYHEVELKLGRVRMIRAKGFSFWDPNERQIERVPFHQVERLRLASKRDRNVLGEPPVFPFRRLPHLLFNVSQVYFAHTG